MAHTRSAKQGKKEKKKVVAIYCNAAMVCLGQTWCLIACNNENFTTQPKCSSIDIQLTISRDIYPFKMITQLSFFETGKFSGHMAYQYGKKCMLRNKMYIMFQYIIKCVRVFVHILYECLQNEETQYSFNTYFFGQELSSETTVLFLYLYFLS